MHSVIYFDAGNNGCAIITSIERPPFIIIIIIIIIIIFFILFIAHVIERRLRFLRPSGRLGVFVGNSYLCIGGYTQNATPTGRLGSCNLRGFYRCLGLQKKVHM